MSISFLEIYDGASIISCYPIPCPCSVVYLKMTVYHRSNHSSITDTSVFSNYRVCPFQQCASPDPTIKWVKVMKSITWMIKAIHDRCWMLIERICTNTIITAIAIDPLSSDQTSSTPSQYNNNHLHVSVILESHFVNNCTLRIHQISLFEYCKTPADIDLYSQNSSNISIWIL